jgi:GT2 family glycosyltransferase
VTGPQRAGEGRVTVVIPGRNVATTIDRTLASIDVVHALLREIVYVDDGSDDASIAHVAAFASGATAPVRVVPLAGQNGAAAARNEGARRATSELVAFVDADVVLAANCLERLVAAVDHGFAAAVALYRARSAAGGWLADFQTFMARQAFLGVDPDDSPYLGTQCVVLPRSVFEAHGGFDTAYGGATVEDFELGLRIRAGGARIAVVRDAEIAHNRRFDAASFARNYFRKSGDLVGLLRAAGRGDRAVRTAPYSGAGNVAGLLLGLAGAVAAVVGVRRPALRAAAAVAIAANCVVWRPFLVAARREFGPRGMVILLALRLLASAVAAAGAVVALSPRCDGAGRGSTTARTTSRSASTPRS